MFLCSFSLFAQSGPSVDRQDFVSDRPLWRQALGGEVLALSDVMAQSVVVILDGGNIRAYSAAGTPLWNFWPGGRLSPYVTRSREGTSYISRTNGALIAINRSGRELWRRFPGSPLLGNIVIGWDGRLFVPTEKKISCYTASGNLLWSKTFESPFALGPYLDKNGGIILALENNEVYRFSPFGEMQIRVFSKKPAALLSVSGKTEPQIIILYTDGTIEITGIKEDWYISAQAESSTALTILPSLPSRPIAAAGKGNEIAAVLTDGRVFFISIDEGKIIWNGDSHIRVNARSETEAAMVFDERGVYILSKNGASGFTRDGRRLWYTILNNAAAIPVFGEDGVLYSGGLDWILYTYKLEDRSPASSFTSGRSLLYGPAPEGSYGTGYPPPYSSILYPQLVYEADIRNELTLIGNSINTGTVGVNELTWTYSLMRISGGIFPIQYRITALNLLGKIGSRETIPWLTRLFRDDIEGAIKAAAANAIGAIGVDPEGIAIRAFLNAVTYGDQNEHVLAAIASAAGALSRFSGPPLSETGIRILVMLSSHPHPSSVRRTAEREITSLLTSSN
jgi:outer membrane protein assembly factor BamB